MNIYFLTEEDILEIHSNQINLYGGKLGIRDQGLLLSAIAQPASQFNKEYLHKTLQEKAACYLFHICQNHPFIDGNKRVGLVSMLVFLDLNGKSANYDEVELEELALSVAKGQYKKTEISSFLIERDLSLIL